MKIQRQKTSPDKIRVLYTRLEQGRLDRYICIQTKKQEADKMHV